MNSQSPVTALWRPVVGYEGLYEVSNLGSVRSLHKPGIGKGCGGKGRVLKANLNGRYARLTLSKGGVLKSYVIHRLVLQAFVGPCPPGMEGCHGPAGKDDNRLSNLRWDTREANTADRYANGEIAIGERNARTTLTAADVLAIRSRYGKELLRSIAADYAITVASVCGIGKRQTWKHVA